MLCVVDIMTCVFRLFRFLELQQVEAMEVLCLVGGSLCFVRCKAPKGKGIISMCLRVIII